MSHLMSGYFFCIICLTLLINDISGLIIFICCLQDEENPYQIAVGNGEGFLPTSDEIKRLTDIDNRLRVMLPEEDFASIVSVTPRSQTSRQVCVL